MKKVLLMFAFIATLLVGSIGTAGAQVTYTVYDGTTTNASVPIYGYNCDNYLKCEYVIPADHLDAINGSTISKLTYYLGTSAAASWGNAYFQVFVKEVASSSIANFSGTDDATIVYQGSLDGTGSTMEIDFATPYTYNGGNLLIGIYNTVKGTYKSASFLGQTITGSSIYGYNSLSLDNITSPTAANFIPKTTFTVDELHGCITPTNLEVSGITTNGAIVTWTPGNTENEWVVNCNDVNYPVSGTSSYTVSGLNPSTEYTVKVKAVCGEDGESDWSNEVSFRTECPAVVVTANNPFAEDFNTLTSGIPICWDNAEGTVTTASYRWNYYATGVTGHCVRFNSYNPSSGQYSLLKTPVLDLTAINNPMITFTHKNPAAAQGFEVMYTTDGSTYTPIATGLQGAADWTTEEIAVPALANATNVMFIFKGISNCGSNFNDSYIFLDDVMVGEAPTCPKPTGVTVSNITTTSADIAWTNGGSETDWVVKINDNEYPVSGTPSYTVTGLMPSTEYTVNVKAVCGEGDESQWSNTTNFATECGTFMVTETTPYTQGFESTTFPPTCWSRNHTAGTATSTWSSSTSTVHQGAGAAQLPDQNVGNRNDLVTSLLNIPAANAYQVDFWMYRSTYSTLKPNEGVKVWVNTTPDTVGATEIMYIHREYTLAPAESATGWYEYSAVIPTSGDMYVIFQGISEWGAASYIDDITVNKAPTCLKPIDVTVSNITETTAEISWTEQGSANEWIIMLDTIEIPANSNPFPLTGLDAATSYTVKVKAVCSEEEESDWSNEVSFRTECTAVAAPFYESFEENDLGCWTVEEDNTSYTWHIVSSLSTGYTGGMANGQYAAAMTCSTYDGPTAKLISPVLDLTTTMFPTLTFSYLNKNWDTDQNILSVYYRTDAVAEWTLLTTYNTPASTWTEETISLPNPTATYQIAFEGTALYGYNIHVDAISVEGTSCLAPTNVVVSNETDNSADVNWTAGYEETAWNLRYRTATETVVAYDFENDLQGWSTLNTDGDTIVVVHSSENISGYTYDSLGHNGSNGFAVSNSFVDEVGAVAVNQYFVVDSSYTATDITSLVFYYDYANDSYPDYFEAGVFTQDPTDATNFTSLWNSSSRGNVSAANDAVRHTERTRYNNWREVAIDLSEFAGQQVWIAFHHQDYDNYELWIDDISIVETAEWTVVNGVTNPYTIEGLTANTTYEVQVQAACSEDETSDWTASVEFTTLAADTTVEEPCATPANVTVENNVATWESEAENFNLMYVVANDTFPVEVAGNTYTFEGLEDSAVVTVMVQAICDEDNTSDWSEAVEFVFTTPEDTIGINNYTLNAKVYPNPAHDVVNVECNAIGANLSVYDMFGKVVMNTTIQSERTELNLSNVAPGVYMIRIANNNAITTVKVVKR